MFKFYDEAKMIVIGKRYGSGRVIPSLPLNLNEEECKNTVFDPNLEHKHGYIPLPEGIVNRQKAEAIGNIKLPKDRVKAIDMIKTHSILSKMWISESLITQGGTGIILPYGTDKTYVTKSGSRFMTDIQKAAYRIVSEGLYLQYCMARMHDGVARATNQLNIAVNIYLTTISSKLTSKKGLFRKTLYPRQDLSGYGVLVNRADCKVTDVFVPRKMLRRWMHKESYQEKLRVPSNWQLLTDNTFDKLFKSETILVVGMPDHDEDCVFSLNVRPWNGDGIGFHPAIAMTMGRDFDGDLIYVKALTDKGSIKELGMFSVNAHMKNIKKSLGKVYRGCADNCNNVKQLQEALDQRVLEVEFTSTTLETAYKIEGVNDEQKNLFNKLIDGLTDEEIIYGGSEASQDFFTIKTDTADAGDMGNITRILASLTSEEDVHLANKFYHISAQSALEAKHSRDTLVPKISSILRRDTPEKVEIFRDKLKSIFDAKHHNIIPMLERIMYDINGKSLGNITDVLGKKSKIGSVTRGSRAMLFAGENSHTSLTQFFNMIK